MTTDTHVYVRVTEADRCYSKPAKRMPPKDWAAYLRFLMVENGFDMSRPFYVTGKTIFDCVYAQERV